MAIAAAETYLPSRAAGRSGVPAVHQAARRPRRRRRLPGARPPRARRSSSSYVPDPVVQTFLTGPEFTIDVLCDFDGEPLSVVPRERVVIRAGVVDRGRTVRDPRADRARARVRARVPIRRRRQHPVPRRGRSAGRLRDQPALLGRHSADDRGRRGFSAHARRSGARAARRRRPSAGSRTTCG